VKGNGYKVKKRKQQNRGKKVNFIDEILEMPKEISSGIPKITMVGFEEMLIENYKGILEYEELYIRINTYIGVINIVGHNFNLKNINEEDIIITGVFEKIELEGEE